MLGKNKDNDNPFVSGGHTLFDHALEIEGNVRFGGNLDVEGTVKGNIYSEPGVDAVVNIRNKGHVKGEIHAPKVIINGKVEGDVHCTKHLELAANAVVNGNVHYRVIEVVKGAEVNGNLVHLEDDARKSEPLRPVSTASSSTTKAASSGSEVLDAAK